MRLTVLGCSGGFGAGLRTTALLIDHDVLIDAGTGVGDLSMEQLARIDHVFLTHSHLDHVGSIPFLADTVGSLRDKPLVVHAPEETIAALRGHLFNGVLWPDFTRLPSPDAPYLRLEVVASGQPVLLNGRRFLALPAAHAVPAVGYRLDSGVASLVYTGDTGPNPALWEAVNAIANLEYLIIETAFCDREYALALKARHLCPRLLASELAQLTRPAQIYITHLKPGDSDVTMREIAHAASQYHPQMLRHGQIIDF